ncbi:MAG: pseudouridine synthase [Gammaproteobacteria bacterium]|nr:pseudouridine synthase [Gammaproteobacteria bacterium]MCY4182356.1 pseudouridine synthase [Gammaproteobacteria bacterium]MCY4269809.1 pseudouridine synthase [Gammaproteobacteria bacterium]
MSEKLQKVLARAGYGSRRQLEGWIRAGRVEVNGKPASLGDRVGSDDRIRVDGRKLGQQSRRAPRCRVLLYNKPDHEVCTRSDPQGRPTVFDRLPPLRNSRWVAVGRLDLNTSGLLLLTNDGELANRLMHPSSGIDREYAVRVLGEVGDEQLARLREGVEIDGALCRFSDIRYFGGEGANQWYHVVLMAGRNREVRKLWQSQGLRVSRLKRVRFGPVFIPSAVKAGRFQELTQKEIEELRRYAKSVASSRRRPVGYVQRTP